MDVQTIDDTSPIGKRPYRVLCIDGGGMRGIYTAALLDKLSSYYAKLRNAEALDIGKGSDLIAGTSTGAILGCAAATRLLRISGANRSSII